MLERTGQRVNDGLADRESLDALRAPLRRDFRAGYSPDLLGVVLEKGTVELLPEAVDQKVLERHFGRAGHHPCHRIARTDIGRVGSPEVGQRTPAELERVVVETTTI